MTKRKEGLPYTIVLDHTMDDIYETLKNKPQNPYAAAFGRFNEKICANLRIAGHLVSEHLGQRDQDIQRLLELAQEVKGIVSFLNEGGKPADQHFQIGQSYPRLKAIDHEISAISKKYTGARLIQTAGRLLNTLWVAIKPTEIQKQKKEDTALLDKTVQDYKKAFKASKESNINALNTCYKEVEAIYNKKNSRNISSKEPPHESTQTQSHPSSDFKAVIGEMKSRFKRIDNEEQETKTANHDKTSSYRR